MKKILIFLLVTPIFLSSGAFAQIKIQKLWARASSGKNTAVYGHFGNISGKPIKLIGVQAAEAERAALHGTQDNDGKMEMVNLGFIEIPTNGKVLIPGGQHIMLLNLYKPLKDKEFIHLTFTFDDGEVLQELVPVKMSEDEED